MSFITKIKAWLKLKLKEPALSKKQRICWFVGLYCAALALFFGVESFLHFLIWLLAHPL